MGFKFSRIFFGPPASDFGVEKSVPLEVEGTGSSDKIITSTNEFTDIIKVLTNKSAVTNDSTIRLPTEFQNLVAIIETDKEFIGAISLKLMEQANSDRQKKSYKSQVRAIIRNYADSNSKISKMTTIVITTEEVIKLLQLKRAIDDNGTDNQYESQAKELFSKIFHHGLSTNSTDIHIEPKENNANIRFRVNSELELWKENNGSVLNELAKATISHVFTWLLASGSNSKGHYNEKAFSNCIVEQEIEGKKYRLRVTNNPTDTGSDMIMRILSEGRALSYQELGYSDDQIAMFEAIAVTRRGLIILSGIPNSGKTTSARTFLESLPYRDRLKIVVLADPVEYKLDFASCYTLQRDPNNPNDTTYNDAIAGWLRGNPDVMDIGEIRDYASGQALITVGQVGCLGIGTLHANSALVAVQRLASDVINVDLHSLTSPGMLSIINYQSLVPKLCQHCSLEFDQGDPMKKNRLLRLGEKLEINVRTMRHRNDAGCPSCNHRGVKSQTLVAEMIFPSERLLHLLREKDFAEAEREWHSASDGRWDTPNMTGKPVYAHALYKALIGQVDPSVIDRFMNIDFINPNLIRK